MSSEKMVSNISYIYALSSSDDSTNFRYIGYTRDLNVRKEQHIREAKKLNKYHRHHWINKVLKSNNEIIISSLGCFQEELISQKEIDCIKSVKDLGYNLTNGNDGGVGGINPTEEIREKIRLSKIGNTWNIGKKRSQEFCQNISTKLKGKKKSKEHIQKLSETRKGIKTTNYKIRTLSDDIICEIYKLYNLGNSTTKIANLLNINDKTIGSLIHNDNNYRDIKEKYFLKKDRPENFKWKWSEETRKKFEKRSKEKII